MSDQAHLFIQGDVERKAKSVVEFDFVGEDLADLSGGRAGVNRKVNGASIHQCHRHNHGLLGLGCLLQYRKKKHVTVIYLNEIIHIHISKPKLSA